MPHPPLSPVITVLKAVSGQHAAALAEEAGIKKTAAKALLKRIMDDAQQSIRRPAGG